MCGNTKLLNCVDGLQTYLADAGFCDKTAMLGAVTKDCV